MVKGQSNVTSDKDVKPRYDPTWQVDDLILVYRAGQLGLSLQLLGPHSSQQLAPHVLPWAAWQAQGGQPPTHQVIKNTGMTTAIPEQAQEVSLCTSA